MKTKCLEIRDRGTTIPVLAIQMNPQSYIETCYLNRCGYPKSGSGIILMELDNQHATSDPDEWESLGHSLRTFWTAHTYIIDHWGEIREGDVIDVEYLQGEKSSKKVTEILNPTLTL